MLVLTGKRGKESCKTEERRVSEPVGCMRCWLGSSHFMLWVSNCRRLSGYVDVHVSHVSALVRSRSPWPSYSSTLRLLIVLPSLRRHPPTVPLVKEEKSLLSSHLCRAMIWLVHSGGGNSLTWCMSCSTVAWEFAVELAFYIFAARKTSRVIVLFILLMLVWRGLQGAGNERQPATPPGDLHPEKYKFNNPNKYWYLARDVLTKNKPEVYYRKPWK